MESAVFRRRTNRSLTLIQLYWKSIRVEIMDSPWTAARPKMFANFSPNLPVLPNHPNLSSRFDLFLRDSNHEGSWIVDQETGTCKDRISLEGLKNPQFFWSWLRFYIPGAFSERPPFSSFTLN